MQHWNSPTGEGTIRANVHVIKVGFEYDARWVATRSKKEIAEFEPTPWHPEPGKRLAITYASGDPSQRHLWEKTEYYEHLQPFVDVDGSRPIDDPHIAVGNMARARWSVFGPAFERFLNGQSGAEPVLGVPIEEWLSEPGDVARLQVLKSIGIRSVEEFLRAPESTYIAIASRMPDVGRYRELAAMFLKSREKSAQQIALSSKDEEISTLRSELDEMKEMMRQLLAAATPATEDDAEVESLRNEARALGIGRVGNKSPETLRAEIAEHRKVAA